MKKITKIEYQKKNKNRVNIYLDDSYAFGIDLNIMIKYSLKKSMELDDEFVDEILKAEEEINVYNHALSILARSVKSEKQLREKLKEKGFDQQFAENAIAKLKSQRYLDDERFCELLINSKINSSKQGKRRIKEALYEKGVHRDIIEEKMSMMCDEDELERARLLGAKKLSTLKEEDLRKKYIKLSNYLINKGFEYSTVKKAVSQLIDGSCDDFEEFQDY
ncbi:MAG TPA: recombination regulator RecX [Clostridiales bacterium]|nr:recombination regulator RecX [Clostridiales bacterium]